MVHPAHVGVTGGERSEREGSVGPGVSGSPSCLQRPPPPVTPSLRGIPARSARPEVDHGDPRDPPFGRDDNLAMATRCMQGRTTGSATHPWSWNGRSRRTRSASTRDGGVRPWRSARLPPSATLLPVRVGVAAQRAAIDRSFRIACVRRRWCGPPAPQDTDSGHHKTEFGVFLAFRCVLKGKHRTHSRAVPPGPEFLRCKKFRPP
jgi:hypothetical protein